MDNAKNRVLLVQKILAHLRTNEHKTHWFPALSAEIRFRTIGAAVAFLAAVEALLRLRAIILMIINSILLNTSIRLKTLTCPSLRQRRHTSGSGQSDAMCPCRVENKLSWTICYLISFYLLTAVAALVVSTSPSSTSSGTVPDMAIKRRT